MINIYLLIIMGLLLTLVDYISLVGTHLSKYNEGPCLLFHVATVDETSFSVKVLNRSLLFPRIIKFTAMLLQNNGLSKQLHFWLVYKFSC